MKEKLNLTPNQIGWVELYAAYGLQLEFLAVVPEYKQHNKFYSGSVCIVNQKIAGHKYSLTLMLTTSAKYAGVKSMWLCEEDGILSEKNILTGCDTIFDAIDNPITVMSMYWKFFRRTKVQEEQKFRKNKKRILPKL